MSVTTQAFGQTDVGRKRQHNEDSMLVEAGLGLYIVRETLRMMNGDIKAYSAGEGRGSTFTIRLQGG